MRKIRLIFLILIMIFFSSCSDYQTLYVRNMKIDYDDEKYNIIFEYYDFSSQDENFNTSEYSGIDLEKLCIKAINDKNFNFRLLENVYIAPQLFTNDINLIFYVINSIKIPLKTNIVCFIGEDFTNYKPDLISSCLYNFSLDAGKVNGLISIYDETDKYNGGLIIANGKIVKYLDKNQWKVLNLLTGNINDLSFEFREGYMSAKLEWCNVYFHGNEKINVEITAKLKEYNGIADTILHNDILLDFLENELENTVYHLFNDVIVAKECNLMWYSKYKNINNDNINVNITIL